VVTDKKSRANTAPVAHQRRRQWQVASVEVKTDAGSNVKIKAPGLSQFRYVFYSVCKLFCTSFFEVLFHIFLYFYLLSSLFSNLTLLDAFSVVIQPIYSSTC